jgi:hypothetical protein
MVSDVNERVLSSFGAIYTAKYMSPSVWNIGMAGCWKNIKKCKGRGARVEDVLKSFVGLTASISILGPKPFEITLSVPPPPGSRDHACDSERGVWACDTYPKEGGGEGGAKYWPLVRVVLSFFFLLT